MAQTANAADGAQKLGIILKPLLDELKTYLTEKVIVASQEQLVAIGKLETKLDVLEKLVSVKKGKTTRGEKKVAATESAKPAEGDGKAAAAVQQPEGAQKSFPTNKLVYFRAQWKESEAFRTKYLELCPGLRELMDADPTVSGKTIESQKRVAEATFGWIYIKNKPEVMQVIDEEYAALKEANKEANKPPQQAAEPHTPPAAPEKAG